MSTRVCVCVGGCARNIKRKPQCKKTGLLEMDKNSMFDYITTRRICGVAQTLEPGTLIRDPNLFPDFFNAAL